MFQSTLRITIAACLFVVLSIQAQGQAPGVRVISSYPYSQDFSFVTGASVGFPVTNVSGAEFKTDSTAPVTNTVFQSGITATGINNNGGGSLRLQTSSSGNAQGFIFYGNFTGYCSGTISLDWAKVVNASSDTSQVNELRIATNNGSGSVFTDVPGATFPQFHNGNFSQGARLTVVLPASLNNKSDIRIRIYAVNMGGFGNHPRVTIDNMTVTANADLANAPGTVAIGGVGLRNMTLNFTAGANSDSVLIVRRRGAAPTWTPVNGTSYNPGGVNTTDTIVGKVPSSVGQLYQSGLLFNTNYYYAFFGYRVCNRTYSTPALVVNATTLSGCGSRPDALSNAVVSGQGINSLSLTVFTGGRTDSMLIIRRRGNIPPVMSPTDGARMTVGQGNSNGDTVAYFGSPASPITISGLKDNSGYTFSIYGFQSCNATYSTYSFDVTGVTYCAGTIANVDSLVTAYTTVNSAGMMIYGAAGASRYIVFRNGPNGVTPVPVNGVSYPVGSVIDDDVVLYSGTSTRVTVNGLAPNTTYRFTAYGLRECNMLYSPLSASALATTLQPCVTADPLPTFADTIVPIASTPTTVTLKWHKAASGSRYIVVARTDSTPIVPPVNGTVYLAGDSIPAGKEVILYRSTNLLDTIRTITIPPDVAFFAKVYTVRDCDVRYAPASTGNLPFATSGNPVQQTMPYLANVFPAPFTLGGMTIQFAIPPTADGSVLITQRSDNPGQKGLPLHRNGKPDVNIVASDRWWRLRKAGLGTFAYNMTCDLSGMYGINLFNDVEIVYRVDSTAPWSDVITTSRQQFPLPTLYSDYRVSFSDYAIGGDPNRNILPVELITFEGYNAGSRNILRWHTATERNSLGFRLSRSADEKLYTTVADYTTDPSLIASGTSNTPHAYGVVDADPTLRQGESYTYRLDEVLNDGATVNLGKITVRMQTAGAGSLDLSVMPNPVSGNGSIALAYYLAQDGVPYTVALYDATGSLVRTLAEGTSGTAGQHTAVVPVNGLNSGTYFVRLNTAGIMLTRPLVIYH